MKRPLYARANKAACKARLKRKYDDMREKEADRIRKEYKKFILEVDNGAQSDE